MRVNRIRRMKRLVLAVLVLALPEMLWAQADPDLSGTWTVDEAKSDPAPAPPAARAGARGAAAAAPAARGGRGGGLPANQLVITQTPAQVTIAQGTQNVIYKFDGTETFYFQNGEIRATAAKEGGKLIVSWKREFYAGPTQGYTTTTGKDVYSVAGSVLTVERSTTTPQGTTSRKVVYNRT